MYLDLAVGFGLRCKCVYVQGIVPGRRGNLAGYLYFSRSNKILEEALLLHSHDNHNQLMLNHKYYSDDRLGYFYGYPKCCIRKFQERKLVNRENDAKILFDARLSSIGYEFSAYLNCIVVIYSSVLHLPCSFNCARTQAISRLYTDMVKDTAPDLYRQSLLARAGVVILTDENALILKKYNLNNGMLSFRLSDDNQKMFYPHPDIRWWKEIFSPFRTDGTYYLDIATGDKIKVLFFNNKNARTIRTEQGKA